MPICAAVSCSGNGTVFRDYCSICWRSHDVIFSDYDTLICDRSACKCFMLNLTSRMQYAPSRTHEHDISICTGVKSRYIPSPIQPPNKQAITHEWTGWKKEVKVVWERGKPVTEHRSSPRAWKDRLLFAPHADVTWRTIRLHSKCRITKLNSNWKVW